jgi:hypothetical protein
MKRLPVKRDEPPARPITLRAAEDLGPFELAQLWCDRTAWPIDERTQYDELSELAVMSALAAWLRRWQPVAIHSAILAGARPEAVAGALGDTVEATFDRWHEWAIQQRDFITDGRPGVTAAEYDVVANRLAHLSASSRKSQSNPGADT